MLYATLPPFSQFVGFPGGSVGKESTCNAGDLGSVPGLGRWRPGLGRSPGEGNGYPPQYSGLENSMDSTVHGVAKSQIRLSDFHVTSRHAHCSSSMFLKKNTAWG